MSDDNQVTTPSAPSTPAVDTAAAFAMPLDELRRVAGIDATPIQQALEQPAVQQLPSVTAAPDTPYTIETQPDGSYQVKYATGEVFKGDLNTILAQTANAHVMTKRWAKDTVAQYEQFRQDPTKPVQMPNEPTTPEQEAQAAMIQAKEVREFFEKNVVTPELSASIVANALGVPVDQLPQTIQQFSEASANWQRQSAEREFQLACPEYVDTPEQADALADALIDLHGGIANIPENYVFSAQERKLAWAMALHEGTAQPYIHRTPPPAPKPPVMPSANSASQSLGAGQNVWEIPLEQLAALAGINHR